MVNYYRLFSFWIVLLFFVAGCGITPEPKKKTGQPKPYKVLGKWYEPISDARGFKQKGKASWYGKNFHGKKTANGETYNMYAMTAAHKTLPLGTWVSVRNLDNKRQVEVRINDRGPFVKGRIIDLSYTAAKKLGIVGPGTAPVEVVALGTPAPSEKGRTKPKNFIPNDYYSGNFTVQIGAFEVLENAEKLKRELEKTYKNVHIVPYDDDGRFFYRVRLGSLSSLEQAREYETALVMKGFKDVFVVAE